MIYRHIAPFVGASIALAMVVGCAAVEDYQPQLAQHQTVSAPTVTVPAVGNSPCANSLRRLATFSKDVPEVREVLEAARVGMHKAPDFVEGGNSWMGTKDVDDLVGKLLVHASNWCDALPTITGSSDDGLKYIGEMYWFFYRNEAGVQFARGLDRKGKPLPNNFNFFSEFSQESGAFMDSAQSTGTIGMWVNNPRIEIQDYQRQKASDYKNWNDFFTRDLITKDGNIPSRPITMPERDYIISSPTDCIMNPLVQIFDDKNVTARRFIENPLQLDDVLDVKQIPISVRRLLGNAPDALVQKFNGGTGVSCILMPATYHHFHAPVSGTVRYAEVVTGPTFGYNDWPNLMPSNHNPAQPGTDFSQFEIYQRGVIIIEVTFKDTKGTPQKGYVASIPVGLDTIGSVVLNPDIIPKGSSNPTVIRGNTRLGNFRYGGSMNVLLFSKDLATGSVQTRLGNQIGIINTNQ